MHCIFDLLTNWSTVIRFLIKAHTVSTRTQVSPRAQSSAIPAKHPWLCHQASKQPCLSGLCHFGLVLFTVLWQSPDTVMSWFHVSECARVRSVHSLVCVSCVVLECGVRIPALMSWVSVSCRGSDTRLFVWVCGLSSKCLVSCWSVVFGSPHSCLEFRFRVGVRTLVSLCERALSRLRVLFRVGAWSSDPGAHVLSFGFVLGFRHSSLCVSVRSRVRSTWTRVGVSIGCVYSCYILCCVGRSLCIHWLSAFMLSCLVWTRGVSVFSLAVCSCLVLHMAGDLIVFLFCVSTWLLCHVLSCHLSWPHPSCYLFIG